MTGCCGFKLFGKDRFFENVSTVHLTLSGCETKLEVSFIQKSEIHAVASGVGKLLIGCDHSFATLLKSIFQSRSGMLFQIPVHVRHDFFFHGMPFPLCRYRSISIVFETIPQEEGNVKNLQKRDCCVILKKMAQEEIA